MQRTIRFAIWSVVLLLLGLLIGPASAREIPGTPEVAACQPGAGYTSGCDVDQDGDIDIFDIQLTASRWSTSGVYTPGHTHWGETWTGATGNHGLRLEHTSATSLTYGLWAQSASSDGVGVQGVASGSGSSVGVSGQSAGSIGVGVSGWASSSTGFNHGVWGQSASSSGTGVLGAATSASGDTTGVYGESASPDGQGVYGRANAVSGNTMGVYGESASPNGQGVHGWASAAIGYSYGVYGRSDGQDGTGVAGYASGGQGIGLSGNGRTGVWGLTYSPVGIGVEAVAFDSGGVNYGMYASTASSNGYAGYFSGRVHVNGTLSKSGGSFKIDHPLDPANQYLSHSFVESPDMMNIYNGNVILDEQGEAWVALPNWFEALNRDFRYQLTTVGGWAPVYVAQKISGSRFRIAGGQPGLEVSWQVTGIRHDAWANAHRIPVEQPKPADERGLYLHPVELGQPAELGLDYQGNADLEE